MGNGLRVVVTGASGNVGSSVVEALGADPGVGSILGIVRRQPGWTPPKTEWALADVAKDDLGYLLRGADVVIHLAWLFQPTHDPATTWAANVLGSIKLFEAAGREQVPALVHASSVGAYSPGPQDTPVDESWPTHGWPEAAYPREKAYLERYLDGFEPRHPGTRVVRMRPGFIFKRESASQQRRLFAGPFVPGLLARPSLIPVVPDIPGLRMQALHSADAGQAYRLAALRDVRGAFNLAAEPVLDADVLARLLGARKVRLPGWAVRGPLAAAWRLHAVPATPGLFETVLRLPIMDTTRARAELGWSPSYSATDAIGEFLGGLREGAGLNTPPLAPDGPGGRLRELRTGVGSRP
ncbi:NAD-dependent epimerase/dehydratase family protein [Amycolatopsis acidiphila]|uniref:NAD-dependent epimerase/dehydratase family protein n=1 Tax=Amycolatopsis acidiphila TaxID=715473 RepID=A0A557ZZ24_9PSEU|nr:NAD-dependent epimerase/dehydratase family protein [Amycolatopsis acidiphila]TVT17266.1 NAD-dependent epimerase/dehydratase family protein [Amycolatopsis acidiphila]UIJ62957.1 NAD-dependent epimerase/dehydratase family protein [Amycolatopsis acidiphila]GHG65282.1 NAD-dependent epimerase [Amycolatopsis acidiphila]